LKRLPTLKALIFSLQDGCAAIPMPLQKSAAFVRELFEDLPMLTYVDVVCQLGMGDDAKYERWHRASEKLKSEKQNPRIPLEKLIFPSFQVKSERFHD